MVHDISSWAAHRLPNFLVRFLYWNVQRQVRGALKIFFALQKGLMAPTFGANI